LTDAPRPSSHTRWTASDRRPGRASAFVDLGLEPPISSDGDIDAVIDHRKVSLRWLAGTALTGLAGALLIGSAVYAALNERSHVAAAPEYVPQAQPSLDAQFVNPLKGDRLVRPVDIVAARQSFRASTTERVGNREIVRHRQFTRVATTMTLFPTGFADDVPAFDPLKLLAGAPERGDTAPDAERVDADVSFVTHDISGINIRPDEPTLSIEEIQAQIVEHIRSEQTQGGARPVPIPPQMLLTRTSRIAVKAPEALAYADVGAIQVPSAFTSINVRMVPENVTVIGRHAGSDSNRDSEEKLAVVGRGETLADILKDEGAEPERIEAIMRALSHRRRSAVREGQRLKLLFADIDGSGDLKVARISVYTDETLEAAVAISDSGEYLPVDVAVADTAPVQQRPSGAGSMRLYNSFFETALKQQIPATVISDLVSIFANDVDFNRPAAGGDSFEVFYRKSEEPGGNPEILFASINVRGEQHRYYRAPPTVSGATGFYDENGRSSQKFLIRRPVEGRQTSGFGMRRHPILRYARMHTGVDWAARTGTPIVAAGNGVVIKARRDGGYGNRVEIQHGNGYVTTYSHLSRFGRGVSEGVRVRQGQVIGYVGSTGLSSGPHLHYEVIVNGNYVDPLRIRLARTHRLNGDQLREFNRERERIDALIAQAPSMARLAARNLSN